MQHVRFPTFIRLTPLAAPEPGRWPLRPCLVAPNYPEGVKQRYLPDKSYVSGKRKRRTEMSEPFNGSIAEVQIGGRNYPRVSIQSGMPFAQSPRNRTAHGRRRASVSNSSSKCASNWI